MDIVVQPPPTARAGYPLSGSVIVRLRTTNADPHDTDSSNLAGVATLVPEPNSTGSRDPVQLAGRFFESIRGFSDDAADGSIASMEMDHPGGVGYMLFNQLVIRNPGCYRIKITLLRIQMSNPQAGGVSVHEVVSNPIVVQGGSRHNGKYRVALC